MRQNFVEQIEKRDNVLYVRVRATVKRWVEATAKRLGVSESVVVDAALSTSMGEKKRASRKAKRV